MHAFLAYAGCRYDDSMINGQPFLAYDEANHVGMPEVDVVGDLQLDVLDQHLLPALDGLDGNIAACSQVSAEVDLPKGTCSGSRVQVLHCSF